MGREIPRDGRSLRPGQAIKGGSHRELLLLPCEMRMEPGSQVRNAAMTGINATANTGRSSNGD